MARITNRIVEIVDETAGSDGWCPRKQVVAIATQRGLDRMAVQRGLARAVDEGRLEADGERYRVV